MKKLRITLVVLGALVFSLGLANVPTIIKSAVAGACQCPEGCPCSHCYGKSSSCNCGR